MKKPIEQLQEEYFRLMDTQHFIEKDLDYGILEKHVPYLKKISELSNSVIMIFDLFKREHVYISENVSQVLDLDFEKSVADIEYINNRIHPDDLLELYEAGSYFMKYGLSVPPEERKHSKLVNEYRMLNGKGKYIRILEEQMCLENDIHGNIWLILGITDISPDQTPGIPLISRLVDINKGEIHKFLPTDKEAVLTSREKEVLLLISKGLISKEIADKLFISINTVNTHRQRILEKLQADNSLEAVRYASRLGLI